jgi:hypothetical protein
MASLMTIMRVDTGARFSGGVRLFCSLSPQWLILTDAAPVPAVVHHGRTDHRHCAPDGSSDTIEPHRSGNQQYRSVTGRNAAVELR